MEGLPEAIAPEARLALAVSTAAAFTEAAEAFTAAEDSMEEAGATGVGATDSSHGVIQP